MFFENTRVKFAFMYITVKSEHSLPAVYYSTVVKFTG